MSAGEAAPGALPEPGFWSVLRGGLPRFLREGFLPLLGFYAGQRLAGLAAGIAAAATVALVEYLLERRAGREGLLVRLTLAFVVVQGAIGLAADSTTVYLAAPVLVNAVWGLAFLGSAAIRRPLAGALACAWYPFPPAFRETPEFQRVFGVESVVWGLYGLGRAALRGLALHQGWTGGFVVVTFVTGVPVTLALLAWSIRYAMRGLADDR